MALHFLTLVPATATGTAAQLQAAWSGWQADPDACSGPHGACLVKHFEHTCTLCTVTQAAALVPEAQSTSGRMSHTTNLTVKLCTATHPCKLLQGAHSLAVMLHLQRDPALHLHAEGTVCKGADVIFASHNSRPCLL